MRVTIRERCSSRTLWVLGSVLTIVGCGDAAVGPEGQWFLGSWRMVETCCPTLFPWPGTETVITLEQGGTAVVRSGDSIVAQTGFEIERAIFGSDRLALSEAISLVGACHSKARYALTYQAPDSMRLSDEAPQCSDGATQWSFVREP